MNQKDTQLTELVRESALRDLVDVRVLQQLQDWFADTASISVIIRDLDGRPVTRPSGQNPFCALVMATQPGAKACGASNRKAVAGAAAEHRVVKYCCHAGLSQFAAPIEVQGVSVGTIVMGDLPEGQTDPDRIAQLARRIAIPQPELLAALEHVKPWSEPQMTRAVQALLPIASAVAGLCIQGAELRARLREIRSLYDVSELLAGTLDLKELLNRVAKSATEVARAKGCSIRLLNARTQELDILSYYNLSQRYLEKGPVLLEKSSIDKAALRDEIVRIDDLLNDPRVLYPREAEQEGIRSGVSLGLISKGKPIGTIHLYAAGPNHFNDRNIHVLRSLANQAAVAIENAQLYEASVEKQRLDRELRLAGSVQDHLIPRNPPAIPGFDLAAVSIPCTEVGGDFYDFIALKAEKTAIVIADVAGKGVPGAILMATARAGLRAYCERTQRPAEVLRRLNLSLCHDARAGQFVSVFCAVLDPSRNTLAYTNAGHNPPLLLRDGTIIELEKGGLVLGAEETETYQQGNILLAPGDVILFYTDGVTEALNADEDVFGEERLRQILLTVAPDETAARTLARIRAAVSNFTRSTSQSDDITLITLRVQEPNRPTRPCVPCGASPS